MAANNILQFAGSGLALVQSQATYNADTERPIGNQPGTARPDFVNKILKQLNAITAGVAQFMADNQGTDVDDTLTPVQIATMLLAAIRSTTALPAGTIVWLPGTSAPTGTVKVNGALLSRTTYARLYAYALASGAMAASEAAWNTDFGKFSPGDGSTNFRIPDLRGYSMRAWDDGRGVDAGRGIGTLQNDQNASHVHGITDPTHTHGVNDPGHVHSLPTDLTGTGDFQTMDNTPNADEGYGGVNTATATTGITIQAANTGITILAQGGSEVRVKNLALMPVMFY